jgi:hypothetical protein
MVLKSFINKGINTLSTFFGYHLIRLYLVKVDVDLFFCFLIFRIFTRVLTQGLISSFKNEAGRLVQASLFKILYKRTFFHIFFLCDKAGDPVNEKHYRRHNILINGQRHSVFKLLGY